MPNTPYAELRAIISGDLTALRTAMKQGVAEARAATSEIASSFAKVDQATQKSGSTRVAANREAAAAAKQAAAAAKEAERDTNAQAKAAAFLKREEEQLAAAEKERIANAERLKAAHAGLRAGPSAAELEMQQRFNAAVKEQIVQTDRMTASARRHMEAETQAVRTQAERMNRPLSQRLNPRTAQIDRMEDTERRILSQNPGMSPALVRGRMQAEEALIQAEARKNLRGAAGTVARDVGSGAANAATAILGIGLAAAKMAADVDRGFRLVYANTRMTADEFGYMKAKVVDLAATTGTDMVKLAGAWEHAANFGFKNADALNIVTQANKAARATGADVVTTTQLLSKVMRENNLPAADAVKYMNLFWVASANSDAKLKDFIESGSRVFAMSGGLGLKLAETATIMSVFRARGLDAAQATTQLQGDMNKMFSPVKQVRDALEATTKAAHAAGLTHIDLAKDFTFTGLKAKGMIQIFQDVRDVAHALNIPVGEAAVKFFPNLRGTIGAVIGTSDEGFEGLKRGMLDSQRVMQGWNPISQKFTDEQKSVGAQIDKTTQTIKRDFLPVGRDMAQTFLQMAPAIVAVVRAIADGMKWFTSLPKWIQETVLAVGALNVAWRMMGIGGMAREVFALAQAWRAASLATAAMEGGGSVLATMGLGGAGAAVAGIGTAIAGAAVPIAVIAASAAAIGGLIYAYRQLSDAHVKTTKDELAESAAHLAAAEQAKQSASEVVKLVERYHQLQNVTKPTRDQQEELRATLDKIATLNPSLVSGYDQLGHAIRLNGDAYGYLKKMADEATQAQHRQRALQGVDAAEKRDSVKDEIASLQDLLKRRMALRHPDRFESAGVGAPPVRVRGGGEGYERVPGATPAELDVTARQLRQKQEELRSLDALYNSTRGVAKLAGKVDDMVGRASTFGGAADKALWDQKVFKTIGGRRLRMGDSGQTASGYNTTEHEGENYFAVAPQFAKRHRMRFGQAYSFQNPATGLETAGRYVDSGPHPGTGRKFDFSPAMMSALGGQTDASFRMLGAAGAGELPAGTGTRSMADVLGAGGHKKLTEAQKEQARYTALLRAEQAKLTEATAGGDKAAQSFAATLAKLTPQHRAQILAIHEQTIETNKAEAGRAKLIADATEAEDKFRRTIDTARASLKERQDGELVGLAKLQKAWPSISATRLEALLAIEKQDKEFVKQEKLNEKAEADLTRRAEELTVAKGKLTAANDVERQSWEHFGVSLSSLAPKYRDMLTEAVRAEGMFKAQGMLRGVSTTAGGGEGMTNAFRDATIQSQARAKATADQRLMSTASGMLGQVTGAMGQGIDSANKGIAKAIAEHQRQANAVKHMWREVAQDINGVFTNAFSSLMNKGFKGFFDSVINGFKNMIAQMLAQWAASKLTDAIGGAFGFGGQGGGGGKGGGGGGGNPLAGLLSAGISGIFGGLFAEGGTPPLGKISVIGENGPEFWVPPGAGTIVPAGAGVGAGPTSISVDFRNYGPISHEADEKRLARAIVRNLKTQMQIV